MKSTCNPLSTTSDKPTFEASKHHTNVGTIRLADFLGSINSTSPKDCLYVYHFKIISFPTYFKQDQASEDDRPSTTSEKPPLDVPMKRHCVEVGIQSASFKVAEQETIFYVLYILKQRCCIDRPIDVPSGSKYPRVKILHGSLLLWDNLGWCCWRWDLVPERKFSTSSQLLQTLIGWLWVCKIKYTYSESDPWAGCGFCSWWKSWCLNGIFQK